MTWQRPTEPEIRDALREHAPALADAPIEFLSDGWSSWAFRAGGHVLRFPKRPEMVRDLEQDRALLPHLAPHVSLPVPVPDVYGERGPNGAPFLGHPMLPGVPLFPIPAQPSRDFGARIGDFLRSLHAFPVERAIELGVPLDDGETMRRDRMGQYEEVIRRVFPLVSCEARTMIERVYEGNLKDDRNFQYEPVLVHRDLDSNILQDPESGEPTGVIDFGDAVVGSIAFDVWLPVHGFERLGIVDQSRACIEAAGVSEAQVERMRPEMEFLDFRFCLLDILYGLDTDDSDYVEGGISDLNARIAPDIVCR